MTSFTGPQRIVCLTEETTETLYLLGEQAAIPAVRDGNPHEIKSCDILQPGPAALTDGVRQIHAIVRQWAAAQC